MLSCLSRSGLVLFFCLVLSDNASSQRQMEWYNFRSEKEMKDLSRVKDKYVFVDAYTSWCKPCKIMDKEVFGSQEVASFLNANFVNYKMDVYSLLGRELSRKHQVVFLPTLLILDSQGNLLSKLEGRKSMMEVMNWARTNMKAPMWEPYLRCDKMHGHAHLLMRSHEKPDPV